MFFQSRVKKIRSLDSMATSKKTTKTASKPTKTASAKPATKTGKK
jgi:hypothetical protein